MKALESSRPQVTRPLLRLGTRYLNPLILALAGKRYVPLFAVIHHRGRRSGRSYATPLAARPTANGFVLPLTFGEQADWFRNVQAAGGCTVRWKGVDYPLIEPEVVDYATVRGSFSLAERLFVRIAGIKGFARLRHKPVSESNPV